MEKEQDVDMDEENIHKEPYNKKPDSEEYDLSEKHAELLKNQAGLLNSYYAGIGAQFCELMENMEQAKALRNNIRQLQEDIAKEMGLPRANRINWKLYENKVEILN